MKEIEVNVWETTGIDSDMFGYFKNSVHQSSAQHIYFLLCFNHKVLSIYMYNKYCAINCNILINRNKEF